MRTRLEALLCLALLSGCGSIVVRFPYDGGVVASSRRCSADHPCAAPLVCDVGGECVECVVDADCGGATPACDGLSKRCVACRGAVGCAAPYVCSPSAPVCVLPCVDAVDCPGFIDGCRAGVCSACNEDADCGALFCDVPHGRCVTCLTDAQCGDATRCDPVNDVCVECVRNADCDASEVCFEGACRDPHL